MAVKTVTSAEYQSRLAGSRAAFNTASNVFSNDPSSDNKGLLDSISAEFQAWSAAKPNADKTSYAVTLPA